MESPPSFVPCNAQYAPSVYKKDRKVLQYRSKRWPGCILEFQKSGTYKSTVYWKCIQCSKKSDKAGHIPSVTVTNDVLTSDPDYCGNAPHHCDPLVTNTETIVLAKRYRYEMIEKAKGKRTTPGKLQREIIEGIRTHPKLKLLDVEQQNAIEKYLSSKNPVKTSRMAPVSTSLTETASNDVRATSSASGSTGEESNLLTLLFNGNENGHQSSEKRSDYLSWDEFFMGAALLAAKRSKDPATQVGSAIVNSTDRIVGIGYNGMPQGCSDDVLPWGKDSSSPLDTKYMYVCHAEMNAILNKNIQSAEGCTIYSTMFPCNECAKMIIQSGIKRVVYLHDKPLKPEMIASKRLFDLARVEYSQFVPQRTHITLSFD
jgi:dCMP deaminase